MDLTSTLSLSSALGEPVPMPTEPAAVVAPVPAPAEVLSAAAAAAPIADIISSSSFPTAPSSKPPKASLRQSNRADMWSEFAGYRRDSKFMDVEIKCGKDPNMPSVFCHKLVLASCSRFLARYLRFVDQDSVVLLPDLTYEDLTRFIDGVYANFGNADEPTDIYCSLEVAMQFGFFKFEQPNDQVRGDCDDFLQMEMKSEQKDYFNDYEEEDDDYNDMDADGFFEWSKQDVMKDDFNFLDKPKVKKKRKPKVKKDKAAKEENGESGEVGFQFRMYPCDECGEVSTSKRKKVEHKKSVHIPDRKTTLSCRICRKETNLRHFPKHLDQFHRSHVCDICGMQFEKWSTLYAHKRDHHQIFYCPVSVCKKECKGYRQLRLHREEEHTNMFHCEICGKQFLRRNNLGNHKRAVHTTDAEKKYHCEYCGKGFVSRLAYQTHVSSVHTKDRPFVCRYNCGATYNSHSNMLKHEKHKHGNSLAKLKREQAKELEKLLYRDIPGGPA